MSLQYQRYPASRTAPARTGWPLGLLALLATCAPQTTSETDTGPLVPPDIAAPDDVSVPADIALDDTPSLDAPEPDTWYSDLLSSDINTIPDIGADTDHPDIDTPVDTVADVEPPPFSVSRKHWRLVFDDDFRGARGHPSDAWCYDILKPQCHIWPSGNTHDCDLRTATGADFIRPWRANFIAALNRIDPAGNHAALDDAALRERYANTIEARWRHLDKCTWTSYQMLNWMATDYQGHFSARFDPTMVEVDPSGKGTLRLTAARAPVDANCILGGSGGQPNCQLMAFPPGRLATDIAYRVETDPRAPGIHYTAPTGGCRSGDEAVGANCRVVAFEPHFVESSGVEYWVDADPRWPGLYYANRAYRCDHNIDYEPTLAFRALTCPILNGGVMSYRFENKGFVDDSGNLTPRGRMQQHGRFEVKARIPKGRGAFPAAWMMPESGGWPYDGGEIDIVEARDAADETYQTYHTGKCWNPATGEAVRATDGADCARQGFVSTHLSKGFTTRQRKAEEFWRRDHIFAVEWIGNRLDYFINNVHTGTIEVGTAGTLSPGVPAHLAAMTPENFPFRVFYWILNHSTWVAPEHVATFAEQTFALDYVRNYELCEENHTSFCPDGGYFVEGTGCVRTADDIYPSPCTSGARPCPNGGRPEGTRCRVADIAPGTLREHVTYWVDADVRWPGVYYAKVGGECPYGGSGTINCQVVSLANDLLESGVDYIVDLGPQVDGIFYNPDFAY